MYLNRIAAVAIVDERKRLVSTVSVSDLRGINPSNVQIMSEPLIHYLETVKKGNISKTLFGIVPPERSVKDTVEQVL